ncbi:PaREP1 family protein [Sulfurisphaera ohwakuensis]|uniref:PaREP1 family protein n=1 Tax=Sulfurisphaera ohwakuensis TaxID=69656 RepID=UPI0036F32B83
MESQLPKFIREPEKYSRLRLLESLQELYLSVEMLKAGYNRNSASKLFLSWKALLSSIVVTNFNKIVEKKKKEGKEDEVKWYLRIGYSAPTTGLVGISRDLEDLGFKGLVTLTTAMLGIHRYAYNGLDEDISPFHSRNDAIISIKELVRAEVEIISSMKLGDEERELLEKIKKKLNEI